MTNLLQTAEADFTHLLRLDLFPELKTGLAAAGHALADKVVAEAPTDLTGKLNQAIDVNLGHLLDHSSLPADEAGVMKLVGGGFLKYETSKIVSQFEYEAETVAKEKAGIDLSPLVDKLNSTGDTPDNQGASLNQSNAAGNLLGEQQDGPVEADA